MDRLDVRDWRCFRAIMGRLVERGKPLLSHPVDHVESLFDSSKVFLVGVHCKGIGGSSVGPNILLIILLSQLVIVAQTSISLLAGF